MRSKTSRFLIVTHVPHILYEGRYFAYGPYIREMNIWLNYVEEFVLVAPLDKNQIPGKIDLAYQFNPIVHRKIKAMHFSSTKTILESIVGAIQTLGILVVEMRQASHIHLRCPGNVGLLGCLVQMLFPAKKKTAKYAGNWDWKSKEPFSYRIQQFILRSPILTHSMQTLVYGNWPDKTKNIKPFFTATYSVTEQEPVKKKRFSDGLELIFVGALEKYKSPEIVVEVARELSHLGLDYTLYFCGEGSERQKLEKMTFEYGLNGNVHFLGNITKQEVKERLKSAHFLVFISQSEGWPKAVAESMFWGCVPVTTDVSCVGDMVGRNGERGVLVPFNFKLIATQIQNITKDESKWNKMSVSGMEWSRAYTLEFFESEIGKLI